MTFATRGKLSVWCLVAIVTTTAEVCALRAQTIDEVTDAWAKRRAQVYSLRCVAVGERTMSAGCLDRSLEFNDDGMLEYPKGTKPPLPAKDHRSRYGYACLYDFKNDRARVEMEFATFVPKSLSFHQSKNIRAVEGKTYRSRSPSDETRSPEPDQFLDNMPRPQPFGYLSSDFPALSACGYVSTLHVGKDAGFIGLSLALDELAIAGKAELAGTPVIIVRSAEKKQLPGSYYEFWVDPAAHYRIVKRVQYQSSKVRDTIEVDYAKNADDDRPVAYRYVRLTEDGKPEEAHTVSVREWQINPPVEKSEFVLTADSKLTLLEATPAKN